MQDFVKFIFYILIRSSLTLLSILPQVFRKIFVLALVKIVVFSVPKFKKIAIRNLEKAFPEKDKVWRQNVFLKSQKAIARLLVDFSRMNGLSKKEIEEKVAFPLRDKLLQLIKEGRPIVLATGHLGSFELYAYAMQNAGIPLSFVARNFYPKRLDLWWTKVREQCGNQVISREGALRGTLKALKQGRVVGVLFDQNITRQHAVFVDWFGTPAATSKLVGIAAVRTDAVVWVASMKYLQHDRYEIIGEILDFSELYRNESIDFDGKILEVTKQASNVYVNLIRQSPGEWFWMHRRWKTTPEGVEEDFYKDM